MPMMLTTRASLGRIFARPAQRWMLYWAVGCGVTIYLWTVAGLRDSVSNLSLEPNLQAVQLVMLLATSALSYRVLVMWRNAKGSYREPVAVVAVRSRNERDLKAVRT
jgi:hypothetical protein